MVFAAIGKFLASKRASHQPSTRSHCKSAQNGSEGPVTLSERDSELYDLVIDMNWDRVIWYCQEYPSTARFVEGDSSETPLHAAVQMHPSVWVIRALIEAYPPALTMTARNGESPLHMACRFKASVEVLQELVQWQPSSILIDTKFGFTPVHTLWQSHTAVEDRADHDSELWQKMKILLQGVAKYRQEEWYGTKEAIPEQATLYILHAAVSLGSPHFYSAATMEILNFCLEQYPKQIRQRDESGRLPLHLATGPARWSCRAKRRYKPRELETLQRLLDLHPEAAQVSDPTTPGRLPLHTALAHRHEWVGGVELLVRCYPDALVLPDPVTGLLPFLASAVPVGDTSVDLTTIYGLLRSLPTALGVARGKDQKRNQESAHDASEEQTRALRRSKRNDVWHYYALASAMGLAGMGLAAYLERDRFYKPLNRSNATWVYQPHVFLAFLVRSNLVGGTGATYEHDFHSSHESTVSAVCLLQESWWGRWKNTLLEFIFTVSPPTSCTDRANPHMNDVCESNLSLLATLNISNVTVILFAGMTCLALLSSCITFLKRLTLHGKVLVQNPHNDTSKQSPNNHRQRQSFLDWLSRDDYWMVPKQRFLHFYIVGATSLILVRRQAVDPWHSSASLAQGLLLLHIFRRLYECLYIHQWRSSSRMHLAAYMLGMVYYAMLPFLFCRIQVYDADDSESSYTSMAHRKSLNILLRTAFFALCMFAQYQQGRHHLILANLRRNSKDCSTSTYALPLGGWFEQVACPHYLAEILLYIGLAILLGDVVRGSVIVAWVTTSLTLNALEAQRWYQRTIPDYAILQRKAIVPYII